jgi:iron complex transport system permease protein
MAGMSVPAVPELAAASRWNAARHPSRLPLRWLMASACVAVVAFVVAVGVGPVGIPVGRVAREVLDRLPLVHVDSGLSPIQSAIVGDVRLPRAVLAFTVGALLATSGGAYQGVFRNPLADPYLLGAAQGAGLGATIAIVGVGDHLGGSPSAAPAAAFVGALAAVGLAYALGASADGLRSNASLILSGVAVAALFGALQTFFLQQDDEAISDVYTWLLGRLNVAGWDDVRTLLPYAVLSLTVLLLAAPHLDVLAVGDREAEALGARPARVRLVVVLAATLGTAAAVSVSGLIGFVGIIVPHAVRLRIGPSYRRILPLAALLGGAFLCLADLTARTVLDPAEVPIGVITAVVGAPTFLLLLRAKGVERA